MTNGDWVRHRDELLNLATGATIYVSDEPQWSIEHNANRTIRTLHKFDEAREAMDALDGMATYLDATPVPDVFLTLQRLREVDEIHRQIWK